MAYKNHRCSGFAWKMRVVSLALIALLSGVLFLLVRGGDAVLSSLHVRNVESPALDYKILRERLGEGDGELTAAGSSITKLQAYSSPTARNRFAKTAPHTVHATALSEESAGQTPLKMADVAGWLAQGSDREVTLIGVFEALHEKNGLDYLLKAVNAVAASSVPVQRRKHMFRYMGHVGQVPKQVAAYKEAARKPGVSHVCEIGFNAGHSAMAFLHNNPLVKYTAFDLGNLGRAYARLHV